MNEDPILIIDAYLNHVREHLPESMVDEVIAELRGYMIEMAESLSGGDVTNASAKRVVARFGAPSELAKEYILPDVDTTERVDEAHQLQQEPEEDIQEQRRELSPASYTGTFLKFITIVLLWLVIYWTTITPFAIWWTTSPTILAPILQFGVVATAFIALLLKSKSRGLQLRSVMFWNWSGLQKLVTFPENLALEIYGTIVLVDIGLTILTVFGFVVLSGLYYLYATPMILFLIIHLVYAVRRLGNSDPVSFIRREYVVNVALLMLLNGVIAWGSTPWISNSLSPFLVWISLGYSTLILYQIVIRAQDLWWEVSGPSDNYPEKSPILSPEKKLLLNRTKRTALRTMVGIVASFSAIIIFGYLLLFLINTRIFGPLWNTHALMLVVWVSFLANASVGLALVYFGVRYYLVRSRGRTSVIGKRTRVEAFLDLLVIGVVVSIFLIPTWSYWVEELMSDVVSLSYDADPIFRFVFSIATFAWVLVLLIAIITRIVADLGDLKERGGDFANEVMALSGNLFMIGTALITGIYFMILTNPISYMPILNKVNVFSILSLAVLVIFAFQKSTAGAKLRWRREGT